MRKYYYLLLFIFSAASHASIVVGGTRVIFEGEKKTTTISVENKDRVTNIVQSWLSVVDSSSPPKDAFIITPPLFKLKAGEQGFVRIVRTGKPLPEDRETMLWLNVKGIPAMEQQPDKNVVQFAINSRIKFIYRPTALKDASPEKAAPNLQWFKDNGALRVNNPSPLYINFSQIQYNGVNISGGWFVAPHAELVIPKKDGITSPGSAKIVWSIINDYGMPGKKYNTTIQ